MTAENDIARPASVYHSKILIAVDDQDVLDEVAALLGQLEFSLAIARDAAKAAGDLLGDPAIKVLITDARMLKSEGFRLLECLAELRDQERPIRTVVVSSYASLKFVQRAMQLGVTDLLHGPLMLGELGYALTWASALVAGEGRPGKSTEEDLVPARDVTPVPAAGPAPPAQQAALPSASVNEHASISRLVAVENIKRRHLEVDLFGDPCWNMILDLAVAEQNQREVSITSLCLASGEPMSTALRHLEKLVHHGYLIRRLDPKDRRRILVGLTDDARNRLTRLRQELARLEFPLVQ